MKNKKKKQLPLLLLALLFITTAAYGTRAYFTDQATQNSGISLQVGNLSIDPSDNNAIVWTYTPLEAEPNDKLGATFEADNTTIIDPTQINNVQPGDAFTGVFTLKNTGSLSQVVTASNDFVAENNNDIFLTTIDNTLTNNTTTQTGSTVTVEPNETVSVKLIVTVSTDDQFNNTHNSGSGNAVTDTNIALTAIKGALKVTADQTNK